MSKISILIILIVLAQIIFPQSAVACETGPEINVTPTSINFGTVSSGTNSLPRTVTVTNDGDEDLVIFSVNITGTNASQFFISSINATPQTLYPGDSASVTIIFRPTSAGNKSARLRIYSNDANENPFTVALSGTCPEVPKVPDITVSSTSVDFGSVQLDSTSASKNVTVTNDGNANLTIGSLVINDSQFSISSGNISGQTLGPGASADISLVFSPTAIGTHSANLNIPSNDPNENPFTVVLSGTCPEAPKPDITVSPTSVDFGSVQLGSSSATQNVSVTNDGNANLTIGSLVINDSQFSISSGNISGQTLGPGASADISLVFSPTAIGTHSANLNIPSNDPNENPFTVVLSGTCPEAPKPDITVSPTSVDFGSVQIDATSVSKNVTVTNDGTANLTIGNLTINNGRFTISSGNISGETLLPGNSRIITLVFSPTAIGAQSANLTIPSNDPDVDENPFDVTLSGTGTPKEPDITVFPTSVDFGSVQIDATSASKNVTVTNDGTANLTIGNLTINNGRFTISSGNISGETLLPGNSRIITLVFKPTATGAQSANLTIPSNDPDEDENPFDVTLSGTGTPKEPDITVFPTSVDFGSVQVDATSTPKNVTVTNDGTANLTIGNLTINNGRFTISSGNISGETLLPGNSRIITLVFKPTATGAQSANLTIPSNDPDVDENPFDVSLSGTGIPKVPDITVFPTSVDFGSVQIDATSASKNVTVTNDGTANLTIGNLTINDGRFTIASGNISGETLLPGNSRVITLVFKPTATGAQSANLTIPSNDPDVDENPFDVTLSGTGTAIPPAVPDITVSPTSIDFGSVQVNSTSSPKYVTVTNDGTANLTIGNLTINNGRFTISSGNISGETLLPGNSRIITLVFKPTATGAQSANLTIPSNDPDEDENPFDVTLSGRGGGGGGGGGTPLTPPTPPPPTPPQRYFIVDFLGKITKELATSDGRPLKSMDAPSPDGIHHVEIEAGTQATDSANNIITLIEIRDAETPELPENTRLVGKAYEFKPSGTKFDKPIKLTLGYNVNELPDQVISIDAAYYTTIDGWIYLETDIISIAELGKVTAVVNHLTIFAILATVAIPQPLPEPTPTPTPTPVPPEPTPTPALFNLSNLSITPSVSRFFDRISYIVRTGEDAIITVDATNNGGQTGSYAVVLIINGTERERKEITLQPEQTQTVSFTVTGNEPGSYTVKIADLTGEFLSELWINWWLIAGSCGVIILIIWLVWYIINRRKQGQTQTK